MSAKATAWAWETIRAVCTGEVPIGPAARLVLLRLADRADDHGICWPGHERTAGDTGLSEFGARKAALELEARGLVRVTRQKDRAGRNVANRYQLALRAVFSIAPAADLPPHPAVETEEVGATALPPGAISARGNKLAGGSNEVAPNLKKESKKEKRERTRALEGDAAQPQGTAPPAGRGGKPKPELSGDGIWWVPGDPRDLAALARIREFGPEAVAGAVAQVMGTEPAAWPRAVLAALLEAEARTGGSSSRGSRPEHLPVPPHVDLTPAQREAQAAARAAAAEKLSKLQKKMVGAK